MNTKQDVLNMLPNSKAYLSGLLADRFVWRKKNDLAQGEFGVQDSTHKVAASTDGFVQLELVEDENAKIFRLGFTVAEAEEMIHG